MNRRQLMTIAVVIVAIAIITGGYFLFIHLNKKGGAPQPETVASSSNKITLTYAIHWTEDPQLNGFIQNGALVEGLNQYLAEYNAINPNVQVVAQVIPYNNYANELQVLSNADAPPDIYQIYSIWGANYVQSGVLAQPPADIVNDVKKNYVSTAGATINGQIWGIPTEVDDYCLLYNKALFKAAGIVDARGNPLYPKTWNELVSDATKLTKRNSSGIITQYGFSFLLGNDWQSVDPFLSLLFSNNGQYISSSGKEALFNSPAGVSTLNDELSLFQNGATDINGNFYDFGAGKVAMVIAPPWVKATFAQNFGSAFQSTVGVAPIPYINKPATLQYIWFMGVTAKSAHQAAAWDFLRWFTEEPQASGTTRLGDFLAENIGSIPDRKVDFTGHQNVLGNFFTSVYVDQMKNSIAEPNIIEAQNIKDNILMPAIEAAWGGKKTAQAALDAAVSSTNKILQQNNQ